MPEPYRRLDTAVLEALVLRGALGMSEDDIAHLRGLDYSKSLEDAIEAVESGRADAGFFMRATPVEQVRAGGGGRRVDAAEIHLFLPEGPHRTGLQPARLEAVGRRGSRSAPVGVVPNAICLHLGGSVREVCAARAVG